MNPFAYASTPPPSPGKVPPEAVSRYGQQFSIETNGMPFLPATKASEIFRDSGLSRSDLEAIWDRSDWNRDGQLSKEEFIHAMYMIEVRLRNKYQPPPPPPPQQQQPSYGPPPGHNRSSGQRLSSGWTQPPPGPHRQGPPSPRLSPHNSSVQSNWSGPPPSGPPPYSHMPPNQPPRPQMAQQQQQQQQPKALWQPKALKCRSCSKGLVPGDVIHHCFQCGDSHSWCTSCYQPGAGAANGCPHSLPPISFHRNDDWPTKSPSSLSGYCKKCYNSFKGESLMYSCDRCDQPNLCEKCWRKGKSCKHFASGSVALHVVKKKKNSGKDDILEGLAEGAMAILGA